MTYENHPIADAFPMMDEARFDELVKSVAEFGLQEEIVLFEGKILDGRNRYKACLAANIEPDFVQFAGGYDEAVEHVRIHNLHRRDLLPGQRAMAAMKLAKAQGKEISPATLVEMAPAAMASPRTLHSAHVVLRSGRDDLVHAVEAGDVSVSRAADVVVGKISPDQINADARRTAGRPRGGRDGNRVLRALDALAECDMGRAAAHLGTTPNVVPRIHSTIRALQYLVDRLEGVGDARARA